MELVIKNRYFYSIEEDRGGKYVHIFSNMIYNDVYGFHETCDWQTKFDEAAKALSAAFSDNKKGDEQS